MRRILAGVAVTTMLLTAACGSDDDGTDKPPAVTKVSLGVIPIADVAPVYLGKGKGSSAAVASTSSWCWSRAARRSSAASARASTSPPSATGRG